jgi:hypothetical protein
MSPNDPLTGCAGMPRVFVRGMLDRCQASKDVDGPWEEAWTIKDAASLALADENGLFDMDEHRVVIIWMGWGKSW